MQAICNVKCMVSASYTMFMLDTINAMMYLIPYGYWPGS